MATGRDTRPDTRPDETRRERRMDRRQLEGVSGAERYKREDSRLSMVRLRLPAWLSAYVRGGCAGGRRSGTRPTQPTSWPDRQRRRKILPITPPQHWCCAWSADWFITVDQNKDRIIAYIMSIMKYCLLLPIGANHHGPLSHHRHLHWPHHCHIHWLDHCSRLLLLQPQPLLPPLALLWLCSSPPSLAQAAARISCHCGHV